MRGVGGGEARGKSVSFSSPVVPLAVLAWMTQYMIGGRFLLAGEVGLANGSAVSSTVSVQGLALRGATAAPWFVRSTQRRSHSLQNSAECGADMRILLSFTTRW